jgi:hypothetical protein
MSSRLRARRCDNRGAEPRPGVVRLPAAMVHAARVPAGVLSRLATETVGVVQVVRDRSRDRGVLGFACALTLGVAVVAGSVLDHQHGGHIVVLACCGERDGDPLGLWLARLPGSMLAPAHALPVWGSLAQVLLAFGLAEAAVGRRITLTVAFLGHVLATAAGRWVLTTGALFSGLAANRLALDTGPSAATVALATYLSVVLRCPTLGAAVAAALGVAALTHSGLAAGEHAAAAIVGLAAGGLHLAWLHCTAKHLARSTSQQPHEPARA